MALDEERNEPDEGQASDTTGRTLEPQPAAGPAFAPHLVVLATIGWVVLQVLNLASIESGHARVAGFDQPARTAARMIERQVEIVASSMVEAARVPGAEWLQMDGLTGSGPLGLDPVVFEPVAIQLLEAALDVDRAAVDMHEEAAGAASEEGANERFERATWLEQEAAILAARARLLGAAAGLDAQGLERATPRLVERADNDANARLDGSTILRLLAGDAELAACTEAFVLELADPDENEPTEPADARGPLPAAIPRTLDGLPELLLLEARDELPPIEEWAVTEAKQRASSPMGFGLVLAPIAIFIGLLLVATRRRILAPDVPLSARLDSQDGWGAFTIGQLGFVVGGTALALLGLGPLTGFSVAVSSVPILLAALLAAGWRPGIEGSLGDAGERLGLAGDSRTAPRALLCGLGLVPILWLGVLVLAFLSPLETSLWTSPYMDMLVNGGIDTWRRMAIEAGVSAPIFEELAFRGVLFAALRSRMGFLPAACASSLVFALGHPYDLAGILTITWIGFALAGLYERTGSLVACMVAHSAYNLSSLTYTLLFL